MDSLLVTDNGQGGTVRDRNKGETVEIDDQNAATYEQQMLSHAERQSTALDSLRNIAWGWSLLAAIGLAIWLIVLIGANS